MSSGTRARRVFVAGATGATGRVVMGLAKGLGVDVVAHQRPRPGRVAAPGVAEVELSDEDALVAALAGCTTVMQLIGTIRARFGTGDTYETSDVGTTRQLVAAAKRAGVDHLVLLSSVGAGRPRGAYLQAKAEAERIVRESGIEFTVLRPSAFMGDRHRVPGFVAGIAKAIGADRFRPIHLEELAAALLAVARDRAPLGVALEGRPLWDAVARGRA